MQLIYAGKTDRSHPSFAFPEEFHITHNPNHWANSTTCIDFIEKIIIPYVEHVRSRYNLPADQMALCVFDFFNAQKTPEFLQFLDVNNIAYVFVPKGLTDRLQPLDQTVNGDFKGFMRQNFSKFYTNEVAKQLGAGISVENVKVEMSFSRMKELQAQWITSYYDKLKNDGQIIRNGWRATGITEALEVGIADFDPFDGIDLGESDDAESEDDLSFDEENAEDDAGQA